MNSNSRFLKLVRDSSISKSDESEFRPALEAVREVLNMGIQEGLWDRYFVGGSYARGTCLRPGTVNWMEVRSDIDIYVVGKGCKQKITPRARLDKLFGVMLGSSGKFGDDMQFSLRNRSVGFKTPHAKIDVVPLLAAKDGKLWVGDSNSCKWIRADPKGHETWSRRQNALFHRRFKPLVKLLKLARRMRPTSGGRPKGLVFEVMVADHAPKNEPHLGKMFHDCVSGFVSKYRKHNVPRTCPKIRDPVVKTWNILDGISGEEFCGFLGKFEQDRVNSQIAVSSGNDDVSEEHWRKIFCPEFPDLNP